jgi:hypothetical protein
MADHEVGLAQVIYVTVLGKNSIPWVHITDTLELFQKKEMFPKHLIALCSPN